MSRRGTSLIEIAVSTLIVGAIAVAALNALGAATRSSVDAGRRGIATTLAADLMAEIMQAAYVEPDSGGVFGPESDEAAEANRSLYDDADDYHLWQSTPPEDQAGNAIPNRTGWLRKVTVEHVESANLSSALPPSSDQGVKRITVEVYFEGALRHRLRAYTTSAW
jgi:hypothetical protein